MPRSPASSKLRSTKKVTVLEKPLPGMPWRPTPAQLKAAGRKKVPDVILPGLDVLFCGINPGLYSAAVGHHFAGPGNLLWSTLLASGFTSRLMNAFEEDQLLDLGYGVTNLVPRASTQANELDHVRAPRWSSRAHSKGSQVPSEVRRVPRARHVSHRVRASQGRGRLQPETIGETKLWLLPNPSGLNAFHQPAILNQMFRDFREVLDADPTLLRARPVA